MANGPALEQVLRGLNDEQRHHGVTFVDSLDLDGFSSGSGAPAAAATSPCTRKPHRAAWAACYRAMRGVWSVVKVRPLVAVIPTLLLAGMLVGGIVGIQVEAGKERDSARERVVGEAASMLQVVQRYMDLAMVPVLNIRDQVTSTPDRSNVSQMYEVAKKWIARLPPGLILSTVAVHHDDTALVIATPFLESILSQLKWSKRVEEGGLPQDYDAFVEKFGYLIKTNEIIISASTEAEYAAAEEQEAEGQPATFLMGWFVPVMVHTLNPDESFGYGPDSDLCNGTWQCYNATSQLKLWGVVAVALDQKVFFSNDFMGHNTKLPYQARLVPNELGRKEKAVNTTYVLYRSGDFKNCSNAVTVTAHASKYTEYELTMCAGKSEHVSWDHPLIAVVVVVSCIFAALLFWAGLLWAQHSVLLHAVLPASAIQKLKSDASMLKAAELREQEADTPAERLMMVLEGLIQGATPPLSTVASLLASLRSRQELFAPSNLKQRIQHVAGADDEVTAALMVALGGRFASTGYGDHEDEEDGRTSLMHAAAGHGDENHGKQDFKDMQHALRFLTRMRASSRSHMGEQRTANMKRSTQNIGAAGILASGHSFTSGTVRSTTQLTGLLGALPHDASAPSTAPAVTVCIEEAGGSKGPADEGFHQIPQAPSTGGTIDSTGTWDNPIVKPGPVLIDEVERVLSTADTFYFDTLELAHVSGGYPLASLGYWVFSRTGLISQFGIKPKSLAAFLRAAEEGYLTSNPYHNNVHAADVLQSMHMLVTRGGLAPHYIDRFTHMCAYLAAVMHDYGHKGVTNDFLVNTKDDLALTHNDRSPQENYHLSAAFRLMLQEPNNFLSHLSSAEWARMRKTVIDLVLATDMKQHFAINGQFAATHKIATNDLIKSYKAQLDSGTIPTDAIMITVCSSTRKSQLGVADGSDGVPPTNPNPLDETEKSLALQMAIKCSDLGHVCAPRELHLKWVAALEEEMFRQGDREKCLGLAVSPLCDRTKTGVTKSQVGFFEVVVLPLLTNFTARFPSSQTLLSGALANYAYWLHQQAVLAAAASHTSNQGGK